MFMNAFIVAFAMSTSQDTAFDVFISYARKDNTSGWVDALHHDILADHRKNFSRPLRVFFDKHDIKDLDDWRHTILGALRSSKILLVCLSPNYFASGPCQWEFEEYIKRQIHQLIGSDSIAQIYFITVEGSDEQCIAAEWQKLLLRHNYTDVRPWFAHGPEALRLEEVRQRMAALGVSLWERLQRAQRAESAPGNLRWQNPHFLGRTKELRHLHESLGKGVIGVVTAVQGLGGMGKTELAVAYAHGFADCYPGGLWSLQAEGKKELLPLIGELAWERALDFTPTEAEKNDPALLGRGVLEHLKIRAAAVKDTDPDRGAACLILLDNVSEPDLLSPAQLATLPGGSSAHWLRIVATTRLDIRAQKDRLDTLAIDALDEATALQLIEDHQPYRDAAKRIVLDPAQAVPKGVPNFASDTEREAARQIVQALGGFTLAIEQVAIFLGIHPEISPSGFLQQLQDKGLPLADTVVTHDDGAVAAQMLTQSKQLGLILDATLEKLSAPARTALRFAALLPTDTVPWPWLRSLTEAEHPELAQKDALGADPWLNVQRRLLGLRLLTSGDRPEYARLHRLVGAHIGNMLVHSLDEHMRGSVDGSIWSNSTPNVWRFDSYLKDRSRLLIARPEKPDDWELDALIDVLPKLSRVINDAGFTNTAVCLADKIMGYRPLSVSAAFISQLAVDCESAISEGSQGVDWKFNLAAANLFFGKAALLAGRALSAGKRFEVAQGILNSLDVEAEDGERLRAMKKSLERELALVAQANGDPEKAKAMFTKAKQEVEKLVNNSPHDQALQHRLCWFCEKLGTLAVSQENLEDASRHFSQMSEILEQLVAADPHNRRWQRDLCNAWEKLGNLECWLKNPDRAKSFFTRCKNILEPLAACDLQNGDLQMDVARVWNHLAYCASHQGDCAEMEKCSEHAVSISKTVVVSDPLNVEWLVNHATFLHLSAHALATAGRSPNSVIDRLNESFSILQSLDSQGRLPATGIGRECLNDLNERWNQMFDVT